jgi:two-component system, OmpR family, phosphate regulon sensor histidine kinase PhoR
MPTTDLVLLAMEPSSTLDLLERALRSAGYDVAIAKAASGLEKTLQDIIPTLLIVSEKLDDQNGLELAKAVLERFPTLPIIYYAASYSPEQVLMVLRAGLTDYLYPPLKIDAIVRAVQQSLKHARQMGDWVRREVRRSTASLETRMNEMDTLVKLSRSITASLDLDSVLTSVVTAAVELTGAEEGSLLLLDESTHELYMRAGKNYDDGYARSFRLPINDSMAGKVIETGQPISFCQDAPNKIKTSYLVYSLIYVPLFTNGRVTGVLGVDNRHAKRPFTQHNELFMKVLADFAVIAIQNAQLYTESEFERTKLETTISSIQDGVILLDNEMRILLINPAAKNAFGLGFKDLTNLPVLEAISNNDFTSLLNSITDNPLKFHEIIFEDGRVFNTQYTPIRQIGSVITLEDITHLKMLDRLKSDFIHTISHDLRSPLTAIIGYVELLDRVGPLNEQQKDFIKHVQNSAHNITELINDLLDLGRIEAGFDTRKDDVALGTILRYTLDNLSRQIEDKQLDLQVNIAPDLPIMQGNPLRLRQIIDNLLVNAIKYTPMKGQIKVSLLCQSNQIIFEVADTGIGIPAADQEHIFEKFYRADNAPENVPGTGLGLAIVKSIVENHAGKISVESVFGQGSKFVVHLPINKGKGK